MYGLPMQTVILRNCDSSVTATAKLICYAAFTLSFILETLQAKGLLAPEVVSSVKKFIAENQTTSAVAGVLLVFTFRTRLSTCNSLEAYPTS
jgi:hypothetical protein